MGRGRLGLMLRCDEFEGRFLTVERDGDAKMAKMVQMAKMASHDLIWRAV